MLAARRGVAFMPGAEGALPDGRLPGKTSLCGLRTQGNACRNQRAPRRPVTLCLMFGGQSELLTSSGKQATKSQAEIH